MKCQNTYLQEVHCSSVGIELSLRNYVVHRRFVFILYKVVVEWYFALRRGPNCLFWEDANKLLATEHNLGSVTIAKIFKETSV